MTVLLNPETKEIHAAMGRAIDAYAHLEYSLTYLLQALLGVRPHDASIILFSVQNVRSRLEMIQTLLSSKQQDDRYKQFWTKVSAFLLKLSVFRNAIVHWTPAVSIYKSKDGKIAKHEHELMHPWNNPKYSTVTTKNIADFIADCRYIEQEIHALKRDLSGEPPEPASPRRFLEPKIRPNLAHLRPPQNPKERQPRRPPSVPKLSAEQQIAKAAKDARKKKPAAI
jgi:hypothetical protein